MSTRRRKRHSPEQIIAKLRDAEAMLIVGDLGLLRAPSNEGFSDPCL